MKNIILLFSLLVSLSSFAKPYHAATIPEGFYVEQTGNENHLYLLSRGEEALDVRLDLISQAKKSIEVEYYIYDADKTGKLMTLELIKAAKRGVKVRMILDKLMADHAITHYYATEIQKYGIEIRYYNTASLFRISTVNFRNHRKLMVIDDYAAITGGRNIGDHYFNQAHDINYDDRDVLLTGPMALEMRKSFDVYWNDDISKKPKIMTMPKRRSNDDDWAYENRVKRFLKKMEAAKTFTTELPADVELRAEIAKYAKVQMEGKRAHVCPTTTFVTDAPGATFRDRIKKGYMDEFRFVRKAFFDRLAATDKRVIISSPYFIANKTYKDLLEGLLDRNVEILFHSNSLASTDAIFMSANLYWHAKSWIKKGLNLFLHDGMKTESEGMIGGTTPKIWGTHAKTHIYESSSGSEVMIGSSNFDNRSDFYNTEIAIFCKGNEEFADEVRADVMARMKNGLSVTSDYKAVTRDGRHVNVTGASADKIRAMKIISIPSKLIDFLL